MGKFVVISVLDSDGAVQLPYFQFVGHSSGSLLSSTNHQTHFSVNLAFRENGLFGRKFSGAR